MKTLLLSIISSALFILYANENNSTLKNIHNFILEEQRRHPTCDPHQYIYGSDERGMWRSNGCSREYVSEHHFLVPNQ